jgi:hypothetical protein
MQQQQVCVTTASAMSAFEDMVIILRLKHLFSLPKIGI